MARQDVGQILFFFVISHFLFPPYSRTRGWGGHQPKKRKEKKEVLHETRKPKICSPKLHLLQTLQLCLKESHRARTVFRKVGGFVYLMSVVVGLEGSLGDEPLHTWTFVNQKHILGLLITVFNTLTTAMRYEPANAKFFHQEVR